MSTVKTILLSVVALATLATTTAASRLQDGPRPISLSGPGTVYPGRTYTYTVYTGSSSASAAPVLFDTVVQVNCDNAYNWVDMPATVTIPAGHSSVDFDATVAENADTSLDTMVASNANGSASTEVLILE